MYMRVNESSKRELGEEDEESPRGKQARGRGGEERSCFHIHGHAPDREEEEEEEAAVRRGRRVRIEPSSNHERRKAARATCVFFVECFLFACFHLIVSCSCV